MESGKAIATTGEPGKTQTQNVETKKTQNVEFAIQVSASDIGMNLAPEQIAIIAAPVNEADVEIRPDGLIYLPWPFYVDRLNKAFGNGSWATPTNMQPQLKDNLMLREYHLFVKGKYMGTAVGENNYSPANKMMTYGDTIEGCRSNALMRLCKGLGMGLELWKPEFIRNWKAKYAETYTDKEGKTKWRKKAISHSAEPKPKVIEAEVVESRPVPKDIPMINQKQINQIWAVAKEIGWEAPEVHKHFGAEHLKELTERDTAVKIASMIEIRNDREPAAEAPANEEPKF